MSAGVIVFFSCLFRVKTHEHFAFNLDSSVCVRGLSERDCCKEGGNACVPLLARMIE